MEPAVMDDFRELGHSAAQIETIRVNLWPYSSLHNVDSAAESVVR